MNGLNTVISTVAAIFLFSIAPAHALQTADNLHQRFNLAAMGSDTSVLHAGDMLKPGAADEWTRTLYGIPVAAQSMSGGTAAAGLMPVSALVTASRFGSDFNVPRAIRMMDWNGDSGADNHRDPGSAYDAAQNNSAGVFSAFMPLEVEDGHASLAFFVLSIASAIVCLRKKPVKDPAALPASALQQYRQAEAVLS